eukprot:gene407-203_t
MFTARKGFPLGRTRPMPIEIGAFRRGELSLLLGNSDGGSDFLGVGDSIRSSEEVRQRQLPVPYELADQECIKVSNGAAAAVRGTYRCHPEGADPGGGEGSARAGRTERMLARLRRSGRAVTSRARRLPVSRAKLREVFDSAVRAVSVLREPVSAVKRLLLRSARDAIAGGSAPRAAAQQPPTSPKYLTFRWSRRPDASTSRPNKDDGKSHDSARVVGDDSCRAPLGGISAASNRRARTFLTRVRLRLADRQARKLSLRMSGAASPLSSPRGRGVAQAVLVCCTLLAAVSFLCYLAGFVGVGGGNEAWADSLGTVRWVRARPRRGGGHYRAHEEPAKRRECARSPMCGRLHPDENESCVDECVNKPCFDLVMVYTVPLEPGEVDTEKRWRFNQCLSETRRHEKEVADQGGGGEGEGHPQGESSAIDIRHAWGSQSGRLSLLESGHCRFIDG